MSDYVKLSELIEKVHELEPAESDCEFLNKQVDAKTLIGTDFNIEALVADILDSQLIYDYDVADLMGISEDEYATLRELSGEGSFAAREKLDSLWDVARKTVSSQIEEYQAYSIGVYLTDMLKGFGYTSDSLVHPCIVDAIDLCIDNTTPELGDFENALDGAIEGYFGIYTNLPEDFEFESLDTKFKFIKDHTEGFYAPEKDVAAPEQIRESKEDDLKLTPLEPDTCYVDSTNNRAVLIKARPFNGELEGMHRFRKAVPEILSTPIYTWHPEYDSPHESEFYNSTDFLLDLLDVETLPFPWQPAGENFEPVVKAAADRGFYIVPIEVRENSRSPYRLGYTVDNGYIADGLAAIRKIDYEAYGIFPDVVLEVQAELDIANVCYQGKGFEAQLYDLETGELLDAEHTVGFVEGFSPDIHEHIEAATKAALVLENCPDFSSAKQQLKDKGLSPCRHTNSLSALAQEAKTASHALSNNDRNIEVKEHEER